jgi:pimeloyl-ACP methyl ester carboxylesterase
MLVKTENIELAVTDFGDSGAKKLALVLPGRLDTKDYVHIIKHMEFLAGRGYYAVGVDPPSSWGSPGDINKYSTTNYIKAVNELIKHFGNRPTLLVGHSRGGAVAALAAKNPCVKALALAMANYDQPSPPDPASIEGDYVVEYRDLPPGDIKTDKQKEFRLPLTYFEDAKQYQPAESLKAFGGQKLIIYGKWDKFIRPERVKQIYEDLSEPKKLVELDCGHNYRLDAKMIEAVNKAIQNFITL